MLGELFEPFVNQLLFQEYILELELQNVTEVFFTAKGEISARRKLPGSIDPRNLADSVKN